MRISDWSSDVCSSDLGERIPEGSVSFALGVAFRRRSLDFKLDDLVAGGRVAVGQPTSAQAQLAAGLGAGRDLQLDLAAERGHADRRAERGFPLRTRQRADDVAAIDLELRLRT